MTLHALSFRILLATAVAGCAHARAEPPPARSPYAGEETRPIKTLSERDVEELRAGGGWGLARAAELNGVPGPKHVLELDEALALTAEQRAAVTRVFEGMSRRAKALGAELIDAERRLSDAFADERPDRERVRRLVDASATARARLRFVHLAAHLETAALLSEPQRRRYVELRGYGAGDACARVPAGHDPAMWRRHHGCEDR